MNYLVIEKREYHPYGDFVPKDARILLIGSFPIAKFTDPLRANEIKPNEINFFFGGERNLLWKIFERIFGIKLSTKKSIIQFLKKNKIGIVDLVFFCRRKLGGSSDSSLFDIHWNPKIGSIIEYHSIEYLIFTSKGVEQWFKKLHPEITIPSYTLLSPSSQSQRALGCHPLYLTWKRRNPAKKPIDFLELSYRKIFSKLNIFS